MDGNQTNNRSDNLQWKTHKEIVQLMIKRGSHRSQHQRGEKQHANYKLSDRERQLVFSDFQGGSRGVRELADHFGVGETLIYRVVNDPQWAVI